VEEEIEKICMSQADAMNLLKWRKALKSASH